MPSGPHHPFLSLHEWSLAHLLMASWMHKKGPKHVSMRLNCGAWGRLWSVGMHWCGQEHVGVVGTGQWDVSMACESHGGLWRGAGRMHRGPGDMLQAQSQGLETLLPCPNGTVCTYSSQ